MRGYRRLTRRRALAAGLGASTVALGLGGGARPARARDLGIGFIYVGPKDDYGYNQAHAEGAAAIKSMPGITLTEEERVPETDAVEKTMQSMIELDGASLLFPTSFGYFNPSVVRTARKYPQAQFRHCGGLWQKEKDPVNAGSYFGYIGMAQYLSGVVAGHVSRTKKLGFVAAKPIPQVLLNVNSFTLGARSVDPSITTRVLFTGDWSMPVKEAEATNALADEGVDVVTCHVDGPKVVVQTAEGRGMHTCGYHVSQAPLAPKGYLTGAEWNWASIYRMFAERALAGEPLPNFVRGGLVEGYVRTSPYGPAVPKAARRNADAVKAEMMRGGYSVFKGPLQDNRGNTVIPAGTAYPETAIQLESMDYLVQGVNGALS